MKTSSHNSEGDRTDLSIPNPDPTTSFAGGLSRAVIKVYEADDNLPLVLNFPPVDKSLTAGRSRRCDLTLTSPDVSAEHIRFFWDADRPMVEERGSTNGTLLVRGKDEAGEPIEPNYPVELMHKDRLVLCDEVTIEYFDYLSELGPRPSTGGPIRLIQLPPLGAAKRDTSRRQHPGVFSRMLSMVPTAFTGILQGGVITKRLRSLPKLYKAVVLITTIAALATVLRFVVFT